jgi:hypothetical protein
MKYYTLQRFVKLNLYFFGMYSVLTAAWYGLSGRFGEDTGTAVNEILFNAAIFSFMFTVALLLWYRRTDIRIPVNKITLKALEQQMEGIGYLRVAGQKQQAVQVYKPAPPKAPVFAGKIFIRKTANFYLVQGPKKSVLSLEF